MEHASGFMGQTMHGVVFCGGSMVRAKECITTAISYIRYFDYPKFINTTQKTFELIIHETKKFVIFAQPLGT